jgi:anti-anti-sigma factor
MPVKEEIIEGVAVISPLGKIYNVAPLIETTGQEIGVYRELKKTVERLVGSEVTDIILDMNGVTAIDSAGLGGLVSLRSMIGKHNGRLIFCRLTPEVESIFRVTELIEFFKVTSTRDEALAVLSG